MYSVNDLEFKKASELMKYLKGESTKVIGANSYMFDDNEKLASNTEIKKDSVVLFVFCSFTTVDMICRGDGEVVSIKKVVTFDTECKFEHDEIEAYRENKLFDSRKKLADIRANAKVTTKKSLKEEETTVFTIEGKAFEGETFTIARTSTMDHQPMLKQLHISRGYETTLYYLKRITTGTRKRPFTIECTRTLDGVFRSV